MRVEARRVHVRAGGIGEDRTEFRQAARDGEFVVAVEEEDVRHDSF